MFVNYVLSDGKRIKTNVEVREEEPWFHHWLNSLIEMDPEVIFFFTTDTTDIF